MSYFLRQGSAPVISFGPFVDKTNGVDLEVGLAPTALDHTSTGIKISKAGGALAARAATVTASAYDAYGCYLVTLKAGDTDTLGGLRVIFTDPATCLAVWRDFMVIPATLYDSFGAASGGSIPAAVAGAANGLSIVGSLMAADVTKINTVTAAATQLSLSAQTIVSGTVDTGTFSATTTIFETSLAEATADHYNGLTLKFVTGALAGQGTQITDYEYSGNSKGKLTVVALTEAPANAVSFVIL